MSDYRRGWVGLQKPILGDDKPEACQRCGFSGGHRLPAYVDLSPSEKIMLELMHGIRPSAGGNARYVNPYPEAKGAWVVGPHVCVTPEEREAAYNDLMEAFEFDPNGRLLGPKRGLSLTVTPRVRLLMRLWAWLQNL